jgi:uncharacterized SAM-binding protein YcdF (DUF218 family)
MNELMLNLGLAQWKPLVAALLLPPVPLLLMVVLGAALMFRRTLLAWLLLLCGVAGLWLTCTTALSRALTLNVLKPAPALSESAVNELKRQPRTAIVVLGGGRRNAAPEYGTTTLNSRSIERLRYGLWLSRETGLPVAFSGGVGREDSKTGPSEAELAARIAEREFKLPLRWVEPQSRDTHENAIRSVALLKGQNIDRIVLVTHAYHMPRAVRNFEAAIARQQTDGGGAAISVLPAPVARHTPGPWKLGDWLPTLRGFEENYLALHEILGLMLGA